MNIGTGKEYTIGELAEIVKKVVGYRGELRFNSDMPDGTPRKLLDVSKLVGLGWKYKMGLKDGIVGIYKWYRENCKYANNKNKKEVVIYSE